MKSITFLRVGNGRMLARSGSSPAKPHVDKKGSPRAAYLTGLAALALTMWSAPPAHAQDWPQRPVRVIVSSSAGGLSDVFMRVVGERLHKKWGQPIVVENRPGGGAVNIAARACADAPNDGYTICVLPTDIMQFNRFVFRRLTYDMFKDIEPVMVLFFITQGLVVNPKLGVSTLEQLAEYAKAHPKTLAYAAPSISHQIFVEQFKEETNADIVRVPFRGGGDAVNQLLGGSTPIGFFGIGNSTSLLNTGALRAILLDSDRRSPLFPDIPTLKEVRPNAEVTRADFSLWVPSGTPKAITRKVRDDIAEIATDKDFIEKNVIQRGLEPVFNTPEEFAVYLQDQRARAERIAKRAKLEPQ